MQFLKTILDFIFPPRCEACRTLGPEALCQSCHSGISYLKPTAFVHSVALYEGPIKKAIMKFKYKRRVGLARPLGNIMANYITNMIGVTHINYLIPVPLHEKRLRERGFNQSELLSHEISMRFGIPTALGLLHRVIETKPQFDLPRKERISNVKNAFSISSSRHIEGKNILLIDDIYTTGATISECTRVLKENGAAQVHVLTLSRAVNM